jgi:hypothetical protein
LRYPFRALESRIDTLRDGNGLDTLDAISQLSEAFVPGFRKRTSFADPHGTKQGAALRGRLDQPATETQ